MELTNSYKTLHVKTEGKTAWVSLNRPESLNALNKELMSELLDVLKEISRNADLQIVVLKGEGKGFCSGGDIKAMLTMSGEEEFKTFMKVIKELSTTLYAMPKITISAIHGAAAGLGLSLALACDVLIAEEQSKLAMNFIGIGLVPDGGGHFLMQERVGSHKAMHAIWRGDVMNAHEAHSFGLIDRVTAEGRAVAEAEAYVSRFSSSPLKAMLETKAILRSSRLKELEETLEMEEESQWRMRQTDDHLEGINAFVEKRKPAFKGQ
ncbi:enoyl-CoA hydratase [Jeotgalibacillus sp. R-1-5s-1]|uniref:enoyl-CoA hydratase n=1 Tax=Jeotgalibacillus sp. R-1-5s-1 TaxID=2555897 RepID=UPI00106CE421|nr:enoyl-CoA hydratase [Jeotgalibacillus sp. R-1-5s-1]TFD97670.1 enoyl-CoA hydratase [Jeotgalibacillus sp. R-1-5s-1]